jgi:putative nucleotidyltransferase with HDIG domain
MDPSRKYILNIIYFILSTLIVTTILSGNTEESSAGRIGGYLILVSSCYLVLWFFLSHFRAEVLNVTRKTLFIILIILSFVSITRVVVVSEYPVFLYMVPFAIIPVVIRTFYDSRLALFILLIALMLCGFMVPDPFMFSMINFITGMAAIFTLTNIYRKAKFVFTAIIVFISLSVLYLGWSLISNGSFSNIEGFNFILFGINGILTLISYPVVFLFEKKFLFLSDTTLLELSDTNQPLLRKLAEEAPGSFQHSLQVANLAEEAARTIGANLLLVRTGSLYHDIGKIANPEYFIENQSDGISPHDNMIPAESARLIINHVRNGVVLARNFKLPVQIIDFIRTHHGTTVAYFFYRKFTELNPGIAMEKDFTYPGPKPFSKETAVVMMADAVEASSRSMTNFSEEAINDLVERIVYLQEQDNQFSEVPLTFRDISEIKSSFKKRLSNIYHSRIAYPERG